MAKPRTFVSSTCLDLKDARSVIEEHLKSLGHEPLLSDTLTFGVTPKRHSHQACLDQVDNADYFVLIIGHRPGGTFVGSERSITNEEYRRAMKRHIPVMSFVAEEVDSAAVMYRKNPKADYLTCPRSALLVPPYQLTLATMSDADLVQLIARTDAIMFKRSLTDHEKYNFWLAVDERRARKYR
jgi:hypothetical protein